jgi:hypothetical protein
MAACNRSTATADRLPMCSRRDCTWLRIADASFLAAQVQCIMFSRFAAGLAASRADDGYGAHMLYMRNESISTIPRSVYRHAANRRLRITSDRRSHMKSFNHTIQRAFYWSPESHINAVMACLCTVHLSSLPLHRFPCSRAHLACLQRYQFTSKGLCYYSHPSAH